MVNDAEKYREQDEAVKARIDAKNELETYIYSIRGTLDEPTVAEKLSQEEQDTLSEAVKNTEEWLDSHSNEEAEVYQSKTKALQEIVSPIMSKLHETATGGMPGGMPDFSGMPGGNDTVPEETVGGDTTASVEEVD